MQLYNSTTENLIQQNRTKQGVEKAVSPDLVTFPLLLGECAKLVNLQ